MTEIKNMPADNGHEPVTVETAKVIQGISLVFCGALTMLEALHPHVSLAPSTILDLVTGNVEGLEKAAAERRDAAKKEVSRDTEETERPVDTADTVSDESAVPSDIHQVDADVKDKAGKGNPASDTPEEAPTSTVTADDITRVIVRKIKQDCSNNEKIGAILKSYGVAKVSDLPAAKYEALVIELSAI